VLLVIVTLNMEGDLYHPALLSIGLGRVGTLDDVRINQPPRPCVCGILDVSLRLLVNMALIIQGWIPCLGLWKRKQHAGEDNYRLFFHRFFVLYVCCTLSNPSTSRRSLTTRRPHPVRAMWTIISTASPISDSISRGASWCMLTSVESLVHRVARSTITFKPGKAPACGSIYIECSRSRPVVMPDGQLVRRW
jgi:hypothetical protein